MANQCTPTRSVLADLFTLTNFVVFRTDVHAEERRTFSIPKYKEKRSSPFQHSRDYSLFMTLLNGLFCEKILNITVLLEKILAKCKISQVLGPGQVELEKNIWVILKF